MKDEQLSFRNFHRQVDFFFYTSGRSINILAEFYICFYITQYFYFKMEMFGWFLIFMKLTKKLIRAILSTEL